jgi:hypothetical protein
MAHSLYVYGAARPVELQGLPAERDSLIHQDSLMRQGFAMRRNLLITVLIKRGPIV